MHRCFYLLMPFLMQVNRYIPAMVMACFPAISQLLQISGNTSEVVTVMARGFVITSILWGQVTLSIIDGKRLECVQFFLSMAVLTFFGVIHSFDGKVYYDIWAHGSYLPVYICIAYACCAALAAIFVPSKTNSRNDEKGWLDDMHDHGSLNAAPNASMYPFEDVEDLKRQLSDESGLTASSLHTAPYSPIKF
jgi:hypothetical protein